MAEYIDKQKLIDDFHTAGSCFVYGDYIPAIVSRIKMQPTIEPEAMPVVQELQAQVKEQKEQLSHLEYWGLDRKIVLESAAQDRAAVNVMRKRCEKTIAELRAELKLVTSERDAAIADLKILSDCDYCKYDCKNYEEEDCRFCSVKNASVEPAKTGQAGNGADLLQKMQHLKVGQSPSGKKLADLQPLDGVGTKEEAEKNRVPGAAPERSNRNG